MQAFGVVLGAVAGDDDGVPVILLLILTAFAATERTLGCTEGGAQTGIQSGLEGALGGHAHEAEEPVEGITLLGDRHPSGTWWVRRAATAPARSRCRHGM